MDSVVRRIVLVLVSATIALAAAATLFWQRPFAAQRGGRRAAVVFVAVTVDPDRDTVPVVAEYSRRWEMTDRWRFLTGPQHDLEPIWKYYWVGQVRHEQPGRQPASAAYEIGHSSPVHLLDRAGRIRVVFDPDFRPAAIAHDIEALLEQ